jgi:membrane protease YdiL (CAAX protease family)
VKSLREFLQQRLWLVFVAHQLFVFMTAVLFLTSVRRLSGRTIHLGRDPVGLVDGAVLIVLSVVVIALTRVMYHWIKGNDATPLGIALSPRRLVHLLVGLIIGAVLIGLPYAVGLWIGTMSIYDRITAHFDSLTVMRIIAVAFFLLLLQSVMEETVNRAFPMRLWEHRSLLFRIIVPSIFFAAIHLADENVSFERFGILLIGGVTHSLAYALTGNIWFASGLHAGANIASFLPTGLWHAGAVVALVGNVPVSNLIMALLMLLVLAIAKNANLHTRS